MSEFIPPFSEGRQLELLIKSIVNLWEDGTLKKYDDLFEQLSAAMTAAVQKASPVTIPTTFQAHEPPVSEKYNRFFESVYRDLSVLARELDVMRAWAIACYNHTTDATESLSNMYSGIQEYYKTALALCASGGEGLDIIFANCSYIYKQVWEDFGAGSTCLDESGALQLTAAGIEDNDLDITYTVLDGNGFAGDLHRAFLYEVEGTTDKTVSFNYQTAGRHDNLAAIADNNPLTWFEWEMVDLTAPARKITKDWNLEYTTNEGSLSWCGEPEGGTLFLELLGKLEEPAPLNYLSLLPIIKNCSRENTKVSQKQTPRVDRVDISADGTNWVNLEPTNVYLTSSINLTELLPGAALTYDDAPVWNFDQQLVKYVRIRMSVNNPQTNVGIGHFFYVDLTTEERIDGPNPGLGNPTEFNSSVVDSVNKWMRRLEVLDGMRWVIGIRDISFGRLEYLEAGYAVSVDFNSVKEIDRLTLTVEEDVPDGTAISYYISADGGKVWTEVLPLNRERAGEYDPPTVLIFNNHYPATLMGNDYTRYVETIGTANKLKIKVGLATALNVGDSLKTPRLINYIVNVVYKGEA